MFNHLVKMTLFLGLITSNVLAKECDFELGKINCIDKIKSINSTPIEDIEKCSNFLSSIVDEKWYGEYISKFFLLLQPNNKSIRLVFNDLTEFGVASISLDQLTCSVEDNLAHLSAHINSSQFQYPLKQYTAMDFELKQDLNFYKIVAQVKLYSSKTQNPSIFNVPLDKLK